MCYTRDRSTTTVTASEEAGIRRPAARKVTATALRAHTTVAKPTEQRVSIPGLKPKELPGRADSQGTFFTSSWDVSGTLVFSPARIPHHWREH